eukprot:8317286-Alexandrium_andersonii.AAC.1
MERRAAPDGHLGALPTVLAVNLITLAALAVGAHPMCKRHLRPELLGRAIHDRPSLARLGRVRPRPSVE